MAFLVKEGRGRRTKEAASRAGKFDTGSLETRRSIIFTSLLDLFLGGALTGTAKVGGVISHVLGGVHSVSRRR